MAELNLGIVGLGYWGPNLLRNLKDVDGVRVKYMCDMDIRNLEKWRLKYPDVYPKNDVTELLIDKNLEGIVISTPAITHYELARRALECDKNVFIEKPMAKSIKECSELIEMADKKNLLLMIGHVYEFNPFINYLKQYIKGGMLGNIKEGWARRFAFGPVRSDVGALWDLASHDIGIFMSLFGKKPVGVSANGENYESNGEQKGSIAMHIEFEDGMEGNICASWISPIKIREFMIMGDKQAVRFDEVASDENLKFYNRSIAYIEPTETFQKHRFEIRKGDTLIPCIDLKEEPLKTECRHFVDCIRNNEKPITGGLYGLNVVRVLAAAEKSLKKKKYIEIKD